MNHLYRALGRFDAEHNALMGRKAINLDWLIKKGYKVPPGICFSSELYHLYLEQSGLGTWLSLHVEKKPLDDMRWEEIWDLSLSIRHKFLKTPFPDSMQSMLLEVFEPFSEKTVAVRSSSLSEDRGDFSFAGLHDSLVNVQGMYSILEAVKEVWSSLWSDRALVYSNRFALNLQNSAMAVIIQEMVGGECSGVLFTEHFQNREQALIETVAGLNENLVSGKATPHRITLDRKKGEILDWTRDDTSGAPFIGDDSIKKVLHSGLSLEKEFRIPLDIEWTIAENELFLLQVRPITRESGDRQLPFDALLTLKDRMLNEFFPRLESLALELSTLELERLDKAALKSEMERRKSLAEEWRQNYMDQFIPLAHGVRLFGQVYNDVILPASPFEFIQLLMHDDLLSLKRNRDLKKLALLLKEQGRIPAPEIDQFLEDYGQTSFFHEILFSDRDQLINLLRTFASSSSMEEASQEDRSKASTIKQNLEASFLRSMIALGREDGESLLDLARVSYKLRDDDNIAVSKIYGEYIRVVKEWEKRYSPVTSGRPVKTELPPAYKIKKRQMTGACASTGLAKGAARVIRNAEDLFHVKEGDVLVCDSIDPAMTFVIPLVSAIVERRGGMLVHGAIIAREYGIPCITGVEDAAEIIETGDDVTVDAYSGIVTVNR